MYKFDFALILTCTINPVDIPNLVRKDPKIRFEDYKKSFNFWLNQKNISKIIFVENSNYDLKEFYEISEKFPSKEVEILSSDLNESYNKKLGKGYGQYLCLKDVFNKSKLAKNSDYFIDITGRHCVKNFNQILKDIIVNKSDIYINLSNHLKFADTNLYAGTKNFFVNFLLPETQKTNDENGNIFENCVARAVLKAVSDGFSLSKTPIYPMIDGFIGTNGKKYKYNFFKKIKLYFFRKLKTYFFNHPKY